MLSKILIISLLVWAVYTSMQKGMIFGKMQIWFANLHDNIKRPVFDCIICMTFWWGIGAYWLIWGESWKEGLVCSIAAMGVNAIITSLIPTFDE